MTDYEKRDNEIVHMRKAGVSYKKIANQFGLSVERVRQITIRHKQENQRKERSEEIRELFRSSNDIEKKWSKEDIVDGLLLHWRDRRSLEKYFDKNGMQKVSLKDVMDFLIYDYEKIPTDRWEAMPAFKQKDVGRKTYSSLVYHLSGLDLGETFNNEWPKRLEKLVQYHRRTGQDLPLLLRRYLV